MIAWSEMENVYSEMPQKNKTKDLLIRERDIQIALQSRSVIDISFI